MTDHTQEFRQKYGRKPQSGQGTTFSFKSSDKPVYKAFGMERQRQMHLWIRPNGANDETDLSIPYSFVKPMLCDGGGFHISIFVADDSIQQIEIQGRNLGPFKGDTNPGSDEAMHDLWRKLLKGEVIWIQEFDPRVWDVPSEGETVITAIKVHRKALSEKSEEELLPGERKIAGATRNRH
jgi:hypothetical protein